MSEAMPRFKSPDSSNVTIVDRQPGLLPVAQNACLILLYPHGPELGRRYTIEPHKQVLIGRSKKATIHIDRNSVSREHAGIRSIEKEYYIEDKGSTNGTFVNDEPVLHPQALKDGDRIHVGNVIFKFLSEQNLENVFHEELYRLATTDGLTMVYNKRFFLDGLDRELSRAKRHHRPLSLILIDIDHFKQINDTYGHLAGDHVLKKVAQLVLIHIRKEDIFARYGGEEFALLLPETDYYQALTIAEKLRHLIELQEIFFEDVPIRVTVSLGVTMANLQNETTQSLIQNADSNLYCAKRDGRNRVYG